MDETGRDLLPENMPDGDFKSVGSSDMKLALKNPARGAGAVKEIAGELQLFVPKRDPAAVVTIDRALSRMDKPIGLRALRREDHVRLVSPRSTWPPRKRDAESPIDGKPRRGEEEAGTQTAEL